MSSNDSCSYNTLRTYNGCSSTMPKLNPGQASGVYLTPNYSSIGYDALTHGGSGGCGSYFDIKAAYGKGAGSCKTSYTQRLCKGGCSN